MSHLYAGSLRFKSGLVHFLFLLLFATETLRAGFAAPRGGRRCPAGEPQPAGAPGAAGGARKTGAGRARCAAARGQGSHKEDAQHQHGEALQHAAALHPGLLPQRAPCYSPRGRRRRLGTTHGALQRRNHPAKGWGGHDCYPQRRPGDPSAAKQTPCCSGRRRWPAVAAHHPGACPSPTLWPGPAALPPPGVSTAPTGLRGGCRGPPEHP